MWTYPEYQKNLGSSQDSIQWGGEIKVDALVLTKLLLKQYRKVVMNMKKITNLKQNH